MRRNRAAYLFLGSVLIVTTAACVGPASQQIAPVPGGAPAVVGKNGETGAATLSRASVAAPDSLDAAQQTDRLIARTTAVNMNVNGVAQAVDAISDAVTRRGGYVASTTFKNDSDRATALIAVRVPSRDTEDFLREVRRMATRINEESTTSQDVTDEYTDLSAQLRNLQATEQQYLELLRRAQTVDEILKVQQQLSNVRGQIERLQGRIQGLERRTDFAQVNFTLLPELPTRQPWDAGQVTRRAWENSLQMLERVAEAAITVVVLFWWLIPLGAIGFGVRAAVRQSRQAPRG